MDYRQLAYQKALKYGLDPDLFLRQINQESGFNPERVSSAGAIGLGQLMPNTARELGVDPTDPDQNLEGAARYMRQQMDRFGRTDLALAAYNAGPTRVAKANAIPNIAETQNYVSSILGSSPRISTKGSNMPMNKQQEEQGFDTKGALLGLASGLNALILPTARDQSAAGQLAEYQKQKEQLRSANKTAAYFESIGRNDLAQLVRDRAISGRDAFSTYTQEQAAARSLEAQQAASDLAYKRELEKMGISDEYAQKREERSQVAAKDLAKFNQELKMMDPSAKTAFETKFNIYKQSMPDSTDIEILQAMEGNKEGPAAIQELVIRAKEAGLAEGTPEYKEFFRTAGLKDESIAKAAGKAGGEAIVSAAGAKKDVEYAITLIDDLLKDPDLNKVVGPIQGAMPNVTAGAVRVGAKIQRLSGQAFIAARQMLKGGGQITDFESKRAEAAYSLLSNTRLSDEDYRKALIEFKDAVQAGYNRLMAQAEAGGATNQSQSSPNRLKFDSQGNMVK